VTFLKLGEPQLLVLDRDPYWYQCLAKDHFPVITTCENCDIDIIARLLENTELSD
jgi:hypothetical protein